MGRRPIPKRSTRSYVSGNYIYLAEDPDELASEIGYAVNLCVDDYLTSFENNKKEVAIYYNQLLWPYIPFDTGKLSNPIITNDGTIHYTAKSDKGFDYALIQYTNELFDHPDRDGQHPAATAYWDVYAHDDIWPEFIKGVHQIIGSRKGSKKW